MRERWIDRIFTGHVNIGRRIIIYGANAMHWAINVRMFGAYWCFHPPTRTFGGRWPWYFYISPNATPWAATFILGHGRAGRERRAQLRAAATPSRLDGSGTEGR